jgi:NADP-dependent 3-hydroxy acid dehydrogenase YdfG
MDLKNKTVLITGAARGLGKELAILLSKTGAKIIAADIRTKELKETVKNIASGGGIVRGVKLDVRDEKQAQLAVREILSKEKGIDVLINNAGVNATASTETLSVKEWDRIVNTNLRGAYVMSHFVFPIMKKQKGGHIINIVSSLAQRVKENSPAYVASKWGLLGLSQLLFVDGRKHRIKVTAFSPAGMNTQLLLERFPDIDKSKLMDPKEVAKVIRTILEMPENINVADIFVLSSKEETWP